MWTYLEEDGHLRRYAHGSCSSTQECHVGRKKRRIKEGPTTKRLEGFSAIIIFCHPSPRRTQGFCLQILLYGPYADGLPWACYLRPAASSRTYSAASSWTHLHPLIAQDRPRCSCPSASDRRNVMQRNCCRILVAPIPALRNSCFFLSFPSLAFPSPSPRSGTVSVLPFLHLPY